MTNTYNLTIETQAAIPHDVLVEHIAVCLNSLNFTGRVNITMNSATASKPRQHPFDGPEVFDDTPLPGEYSAPREKVITKSEIQGGYTGGTVHEGSFMPVDPYPNVTRALDALRADRDAQAH